MTETLNSLSLISFLQASPHLLRPRSSPSQSGISIRDALVDSFLDTDGTLPTEQSYRNLLAHEYEMLRQFWRTLEQVDSRPPPALPIGTGASALKKRPLAPPAATLPNTRQRRFGPLSRPPRSRSPSELPQPAAPSELPPSAVVDLLLLEDDAPAEQPVAVTPMHPPTAPTHPSLTSLQSPVDGNTSAAVDSPACFNSPPPHLTDSDPDAASTVYSTLSVAADSTSDTDKLIVTDPPSPKRTSSPSADPTQPAAPNSVPVHDADSHRLMRDHVQPAEPVGPTDMAIEEGMFPMVLPYGAKSHSDPQQQNERASSTTPAAAASSSSSGASTSEESPVVLLTMSGVRQKTVTQRRNPIWEQILQKNCKAATVGRPVPAGPPQSEALLQRVERMLAGDGREPGDDDAVQRLRAEIAVLRTEKLELVRERRVGEMRRQQVMIQNNILQQEKLAAVEEHARDIAALTARVASLEAENRRANAKFLSEQEDRARHTRELKARITDAIAQRDAAEGARHRLEETLACRICYECRPMTVLVPCGHRVCEQCAMPLASCPMCRGEIIMRIRSYD